MLKKNDFDIPKDVEYVLNNLSIELCERNKKISSRSNSNNNFESNGWRTISKDKYVSNFESNIFDDPIKKDLNIILNKLSNNNFEVSKKDLETYYVLLEIMSI